MGDQQIMINGIDVDRYRKYFDPIFDAQLSLHDNAIKEADRKDDLYIKNLMRERESFIETYFEAYSEKIHKTVYTMTIDEFIQGLTRVVHAHKV